MTKRLSPSTDSGEVLVRVEGVSKKFCRSLKRSLWYGVCDIASELNPLQRRVAEVRGNALQEPRNDSEEDASEFATIDSRPDMGGAELRPGEFWAVDGVSFELRRGECLGLIGHNGAGKTTLLRMLNGLIKPDTGRIEMNGRVGGLIALGAGFNPVLSGRENIYINGAVLGLSKKEIEKKFNQIIEFSELGSFIDMPVQSYSSGMQVRLGFSIAVVLVRPDILLLDEILAVGDTAFLVKCLNAVRDLVQQSAVVLVSHQMQHISSFCSRVVLMDSSRCVLDTVSIPEAIDAYYSGIKTSLTEAGTGAVFFKDARLEIPEAGGASDLNFVRQGTRARVNLSFEVGSEVQSAEMKIFIRSDALVQVMALPVCASDGLPATFHSGQHNIVVDLGVLELNMGCYHFVVAVTESPSGRILNRSYGLLPFRVRASQYHGGHVVRPALLLPV